MILFHGLEEFISFIYKQNKTYSFIYFFLSEEWFRGLKQSFLLLFLGISPTYLLYKASLLGSKAEHSTLLKSCLMNRNKEVISSCFYLFMLLVWRLLLECWFMLNLTSHWHGVILAKSQHQGPFYYLLWWQSKTFWKSASNKKIKWKTSAFISIY